MVLRRNTTKQTVQLYAYSPEWGFSRLQNQGCRFLQHAKIFSHHAKIFDANLIIFSKTLDIKCCIKKWVLTKMAKILRLQKIFLIMQKFLHDAAKITFCSPERPGSGVAWLWPRRLSSEIELLLQKNRFAPASALLVAIARANTANNCMYHTNVRYQTYDWNFL